MKERRNRKNQIGFLPIALVLRGIVLGVICISLAVSSWITAADSTEILTPDHLYPANVERVIDGDTIVVDLGLGLGIVLDDQYLRFYGIDAWETRGEERPKGLLAKEFLIELLEHGQVIIEIRPEWGSRGKGKYGRWLAVIYVAETGVNVNELLVSQGHAEKAAY